MTQLSSHGAELLLVCVCFVAYDYVEVKSHDGVGWVEKNYDGFSKEVHGENLKINWNIKFNVLWFPFQTSVMNTFRINWLEHEDFNICFYTQKREHSKIFLMCLQLNFCFFACLFFSLNHNRVIFSMCKRRKNRIQFHFYFSTRFSEKKSLYIRKSLKIKITSAARH